MCEKRVRGGAFALAAIEDTLTTLLLRSEELLWSRGVETR